MLLRRFATEAAREEARMFCDELVADGDHDPQPIEIDARRANREPVIRLQSAASS